MEIFNHVAVSNWLKFPTVSATEIEVHLPLVDQEHER